ncbi:hypothetical protein PUN28_005859 [Cardiocondyla obscurior]|uniref:Transmembrane protein n=1 Tax=Cardiocondyla obscurior TaxID=286306 RepID=A0AAW2G618_9HYME
MVARVEAKAGGCLCAQLTREGKVVDVALHVEMRARIRFPASPSPPPHARGIFFLFFFYFLFFFLLFHHRPVVTKCWKSNPFVSRPD